MKEGDISAFVLFICIHITSVGLFVKLARSRSREDQKKEKKRERGSEGGPLIELGLVRRSLRETIARGDETFKIDGGV